MKGVREVHLQNAKEGISSERSFTEARSPLQAAN